MESLVSQCSYFLTLTYNEEDLPRNYAGVPCFSREHIDKYIRALRDDLKVDKIRLRYFFTCEEGDLSSRPHYHALLYFSEFLSLQQVYELCKKHWHNRGWISASSTGVGCCKYVAKYCLKDTPGLVEPKWDQETGELNPLRAFRLFSRRPGIGATPECVQYYSDILGLNEKFVNFSELSPSPSSKLIPKVPRCIRNRLPESQQYKLTSVGWKRFYDMQPKLYENYYVFGYDTDLGDHINDYSKDFEIMKKRIKLRKLKKLSL